MKITVEEFSKRYNVKKDKVEAFLRSLKINTNIVREFEESKLKMFLPMMK